ncbi:hypothetical protein ELH61_00765 [Rhizobium ruizarguesonis]|nr:hypothetical protein ELH61_00765 [Rhizobium ruizarguesonis]
MRRSPRPPNLAHMTLTLSPLAGRGDVPCERLVGNGAIAANLFSPRGEGAGRRMRGPHGTTPPLITRPATPAATPRDNASR